MSTNSWNKTLINREKTGFYDSNQYTDEIEMIIQSVMRGWCATFPDSSFPSKDKEDRGEEGAL